MKHSASPSSPSSGSQLLKSVGWFLLLNFLLILPYFLLDLDHSTFWPSWKSDKWADFFLGFIYRSNFDPFRIQAEWLAFATLMIWWQSKGRSISRWMWVVFPALLLYQIYDAGSYEFFGYHPIFWNDIQLSIKVLPLYLRELSWGKAGTVILGLIGFAAGLGIAFALSRQALNSWKQVSNVRRLLPLAIFLWAYVLIASLHEQLHPKRGRLYSGADWIARKVAVGVTLSFRTARLDAETLAGKAYLPLDGDSLAQKPDIYLIFIESYGRVLDTHPTLQARYRALCEQMNDTLTAAGWQSRSSWSASQISGGRSWLAFTSFMTGIRLETHPQYEQLLSQAPDYPHLVRFLNRQGYHTARLNTMGLHSKRRNIPYALYNRFFAFDDWYKATEIPYQEAGEDTLTDGYAMQYVQEQRAAFEAPHFLFFITYDSHFPWENIPAWPGQEADTSAAGAESWSQEDLLDRYWASIQYEWAMLNDFMQRQARAGSLFILIGDHQPPRLAGKEDGFETPVHILAQDSSWLDYWADQGFIEGVQPPSDAPAHLRHEDFYDLVREWLEQAE